MTEQTPPKKTGRRTRKDAAATSPVASAPQDNPAIGSPEFNAAVEAAAAKLTADILSKVQAAQAAQGAQPNAADGNWAQGLALAIAQLSHQGVGKARPIDPGVIMARDEARARMVDLIVEAKAEGKVPLYGLRNKVYLDEVLVDPIWIDPVTKDQKATEIEWLGVPNEAMYPVNDMAKAIHKEFSDSIGVVAIESSKFIKPQGPLGVTANGLVVKAGGLGLRPMRDVGEGHAENSGEGLKVHGARGRQAPGVHKEISVLGTVAKPARVGP